MTLSLSKCHWILLVFIIMLRSSVLHVKGDWPLYDTSSIRLLGLFEATEDPQLDYIYNQYAAMFRAAVVLSQQLNISVGGDFLGWTMLKLNGKIIDAFSKTCLAVSKPTIVGIIGPVLSKEAQVIAPFGKSIGIPVISYGASDPDLSYRDDFPFFYRTIPSDNNAAIALVKLFVRFNWTSCILIQQNDAFGNGAGLAINKNFNASGIIVTRTIIFDIGTLRIQGDFESYFKYSSSRIVVVWAYRRYISSILNMALNYGVVGPYFTWILSEAPVLTDFNPIYNKDLVGMFVIKPSVASAVNAPYNEGLLAAAYQIWEKNSPETFPGSTKIDDIALFAFDATWSLIQALNRLCSDFSSGYSTCLSYHASSFCFHNYFNNGTSLLNEINQIEFLGVSGSIAYRKNTTDRAAGIYYRLQNVQLRSNNLTYLTVLQYSATGGWNVPTPQITITWPGNLLNIPIDKPILKGVILKIGIIESVPFTIVRQVLNSSSSNQYEFSGYILDLIKKLQANAGFIPELMLIPSNLTYNEAVQAVATNVYDIVVADVTVTAKRREIVDFSSAIFDNSLSIVMRKSSIASVDLLAFWRPFSRGLWLLVSGSLIYGAMLFFIMERKTNEHLKHSPWYAQILLSFWFAFGHMIGYGVEYKVHTSPGRVLNVGFYIISLVTVASYTAELTSDLTISKSKGTIDGLDDIKAGAVPFGRIGIYINSATEEYYLREVTGGVKSYYPLNSLDEIFTKLLTNAIDVSISDTPTIEYITNNIYCNLTAVGDGFDESAFAIVIPKNWIYTQDLDIHVLALREKGVLNDLKAKWFQTHNCATDRATSTAISVEYIAGLFLVFSLISILAILLYLWKIRDRILYAPCLCCGNKEESSNVQSVPDDFYKKDFDQPNFVEKLTVF